MLYQDRNGTYTSYTLEDGSFVGTQKEYEPFVTFDVKLQWTAEKYLVYLDVNNLLNKQYFDIGNVQQPGIWVKAGVKIRLTYR
jgi:iron complex outermembrane receptor protein